MLSSADGICDGELNPVLGGRCEYRWVVVVNDLDEKFALLVLHGTADFEVVLAIALSVVDGQKDEGQLLRELGFDLRNAVSFGGRLVNEEVELTDAVKEVDAQLEVSLCI